MDHAINALREHLEPERDCLVEEWDSGKYKKLTDCPSYEAVKALVDAMQVLERYYYGQPKTMKVNELIY